MTGIPFERDEQVVCVSGDRGREPPVPEGMLGRVRTLTDTGTFGVEWTDAEKDIRSYDRAWRDEARIVPVRSRSRCKCGAPIPLILAGAESTVVCPMCGALVPMTRTDVLPRNVSERHLTGTASVETVVPVGHENAYVVAVFGAKETVAMSARRAREFARDLLEAASQTECDYQRVEIRTAPSEDDATCLRLEIIDGGVSLGTLNYKVSDARILSDELQAVIKAIEQPAQAPSNEETR